MFVALALLCALTCVSPQARAHDDNILDPHNATPGVRLELLELPRTKTASPSAYRLRLTGTAPGLEFELWTQQFGALFRKVSSGLRADEEGNVVSHTRGKGSRAPAQVTVAPGSSAEGAAWSVALVSSDRTIRAFAATIPRPIVSRSGPCMLQLELVSYNGDRFVATGSGFTPGDEVTVQSTIGGLTTDRRRTIPVDGRLPTDVIVRDAVPRDPHARYAVTAHSCNVAVDYKWGRPALVRR